ncbi:phytanoyl-CoA dioxygenase family protein [Acanthopleuribacter pedis]|uniref:Phytanoyl-CoA dioxygenase family protein n=1 Tax=Acanthopleuribacter pedis TaxID=442870 RepID=A0A8J7U8C5_9BACT|nr:phytanoyl-CoA dioxygenase family protein [Acanthopleuribacter pedis]MBO1323443.1 phytanoyl-CoA dioxygenase family protein [Acanthopleuribacter pedis]
MIGEWVLQFRDQGYLLLEDFFEGETTDLLQDLIQRHFGFDPNHYHNDEFLSKAATEVIPWFPMQEGCAPFKDLTEHPTLNFLTQAILGSAWQSLGCMVMFSKAQSRGQAWHQDCPPDVAEVFNLNRLVYTHDVDPRNGGQVVVVPGSHRRGVLPVGDGHEDLADQIVLAPRKGDLLLLHGHTWHRVTPVADQPRVSTNYRAVPRGVPLDVTDICVYRTMRYQFSTNQVVQERVS